MATESKMTDLSTPAPAKSAPAVVTAQDVKSKFSGGSDQLSGNKKTIEIYASDQEGGNFAVLVGINGVMYQIPRGSRQEVPEEVVMVLRDAMQTITSPNPAGGVTTRDVPRYNFQTHD